MQQSEVFEMFRPILEQGKQRRRITDYAAVLLLGIVLAAWGYSIWRNSQVPKIEAIALVPGSIVIIGPAENVTAGGRMEFCPGDLFMVRFQLAIEGEGVIYADDAAHRQNQTVKFSTLWRDYANTGVRTYENPWVIPRQPEMMMDGKREWVAGEYQRIISVAASNIYISRYVPPATFKVPFVIAENCP